MTWGFPCQDISIAGRQKGIVQGETRSGLYYEGLNILKQKRPKYSIIENVKGLTLKKFQQQFQQILEDLKEVGYNNHWKVLNAKDYGIPQNRERVFIVSIRKDIDDNKFQFPSVTKNRIKLIDLLENKVNEKYYLKEKRLNIIENNLGDVFRTNFIIGSSQKNAFIGDDSVCPTLTEAMSKGGGHTPMIDQSKIILRNRGNWKVKEDGIVSCIPASYYKGIDNHAARAAVLHDFRIRRLTPLECFRLMGYDDRDYYILKENNISDTQIYKMAGNSIVVNVLEAIFKALFTREY